MLAHVLFFFQTDYSSNVYSGLVKQHPFYEKLPSLSESVLEYFLGESFSLFRRRHAFTYLFSLVLPEETGTNASSVTSKYHARCDSRVLLIR